MNTLPTLTRAGLFAAALCLVASPLVHAEGSSDAQAQPEKKLSASQKQFDKDGDGKLNETEAAAYKEYRKAERKAQLEKYDTDKDGKLSDEEKAAMKEDMKKQKEETKKKQ